MELADLPLRRRIGAYLKCLADYPALAVEQRYELLEAALWPVSETIVPGKPPPRARVSRPEREHAVDLVRRLHLDEAEVASQYDVAPSTIRSWVRKAANEW